MLETRDLVVHVIHGQLLGLWKDILQSKLAEDQTFPDNKPLIAQADKETEDAQVVGCIGYTIMLDQTQSTLLALIHTLEEQVHAELPTAELELLVTPW